MHSMVMGFLYPYVAKALADSKSRQQKQTAKAWKASEGAGYAPHGAAVKKKKEKKKEK